VNGLDLLPNDLAAAHAMLRAERAARQSAERQLAERDVAIARQTGEVATLRVEIERLKLLLAKARHAQYGRSAERGDRLIEQLELQLADLEESAAEEETAAEIAAPKKQVSPSHGSTRKPARRPLPENLPRERMPQVRRPGLEAGRGHHRDARVRTTALEGGRARAREG
jgi:transposase